MELERPRYTTFDKKNTAKQTPTPKYQLTLHKRRGVVVRIPNWHSARSGFEMTSISGHRGLLMNCFRGIPPSCQAVTVI
jgi:hypothetical protein